MLLHMEIDRVFSMAELKLFAASLALPDRNGRLRPIDLENVEGETKIEKCLGLAMLMDRHGRLLDLLKALADERPEEDWSVFS